MSTSLRSKTQGYLPFGHIRMPIDDLSKLLEDWGPLHPRNSVSTRKGNLHRSASALFVSFTGIGNKIGDQYIDCGAACKSPFSGDESRNVSLKMSEKLA